MRRAQELDVTDVLIPSSPLVHANLSVPALYEAAVRNREGMVSAGGALVVETGKHTGRSPVEYRRLMKERIFTEEELAEE